MKKLTVMLMMAWLLTAVAGSAFGAGGKQRKGPQLRNRSMGAVQAQILTQEGRVHIGRAILNTTCEGNLIIGIKVGYPRAADMTFGVKAILRVGERSVEKYLGRLRLNRRGLGKLHRMLQLNLDQADAETVNVQILIFSPRKVIAGTPPTDVPIKKPCEEPEPEPEPEPGD